MEQKIKNEIKKAMLNKDNIRKDTLRSVISVAQLKAKEAKSEVNNSFILDALNKEMKSYNQAIEICKTNTESNFYKETIQKINILKEFLPKQLSEEEIRVKIRELLTNIDVTNKGLVMKTIMPKLKNLIDGKTLNKLILEEIQ